jgi:hypothetical protein
MRLAALGFGLCFVLGFLLLFGSARCQTVIFLISVFDLEENFCFFLEAGLSSFLLGDSLPLLSSWLTELSPLIDPLLPLLFDSLDFLEEGSPKRISRKSLSFSKRDKSSWAGDCVGSGLGTAVSGANDQPS